MDEEINLDGLSKSNREFIKEFFIDSGLYSNKQINGQVEALKRVTEMFDKAAYAYNRGGVGVGKSLLMSSLIQADNI